MYSGDAEFAEVLRRKMDHELVADAEIPRWQRRISVPPLACFAAIPERNTAIVQAWATVYYTIKGDCARLRNPLRDSESDCEKNELEKYECKT